MCVLLAALCLLSSVGAQERTIGNVLDVEGEWYLDGRPGQELSKGSALPPNGVIRIPSPSRFAYIVILYTDNSQPITKRCRNPGECAQPIFLWKAVQRKATWPKFIADKFFGGYRRNPVTASPNEIRSADGVLREAVVYIKGGSVDLAPVFAEMNNGTYYVRLQRRMPDGKMADVESAKPITAKWNSGILTTNPAANLQPGLYEVVLLEKRGAEYKPLTSAWFLAGTLYQYAQTAFPFCEAARLTATWKDQVSEGTVRDFLRAFRIQLASESQPTHPAK